MTMHNTALSGTTTDTLSIEKSPDRNEATFENPSVYLDNRTAVEADSMVDNTLLLCEVKRVGTSTATPTIHWIRNGELISAVQAFMSDLEITSFTASDAGVYQCIFIDNDTDAEILTTIPYRLDTGKFIPTATDILGMNDII